MNEILIVTTMVDSSTIKRNIIQRKPLRWVYLARDYRLMKQFSRELGENFAAVSITGLLDQISEEIRTEHVEWIDSLNRANGGRLSWWFGAISSRNVYFCRLFLYSCYLLVLQRIWQREETRPDLIIADSQGLAECVSIWLRSKNIMVKVKKGSAFKRLLRNSRPFVQYVVTTTVLAARYVAAFVTRSGTPLRVKTEPWVVVDTFVHDYSLAEDGTFTDRYFPFLHEYLTAERHQVLVHPVLYGFRFNYVSIFRRMRKSSTSFIVPEDYLRLSDYAAAILSAFTLRSMNIATDYFKGFNLEPVVSEEHRLQPFISVVQANLSHRLWHRLREAGVKLAWVIDWYENQVIDKALIAGVRAAYPGTRILGAQLFIHVPNHLSLYPSQSELEAGITPDLLVLTGQEECKAVKKYVTSIRCRAGAALRYSHLFAVTGNTLNSTYEKRTILVLTPGYLDETLEILDMLHDAVPDAPSEVEYLIKFHPDFSPADIINAFGHEQWPNAFRVWNGGLNEALQKAAMVVASNSSSMVEAMVKGIPAIFLGRQSNLNMNPLAGISSAGLMICFDGLQLAQAITRFHSLSENERDALKSDGLLLRDQLFTPVEEGLKEFVFNQE
ncbi:MAG: hypothetical protein HZC52_05585 [Planctomycetes bacterium]|uniref:hypothetical protein n=1 Tax=Candidatus Wunengus sp. YC65 TaxID=3367701 RepID=UPI001DC44033|nr:hypothetical protein [Planctomycetota bacterium]